MGQAGSHVNNDLVHRRMHIFTYYAEDSWQAPTGLRLQGGRRYPGSE